MIPVNHAAVHTRPDVGSATSPTTGAIAGLGERNCTEPRLFGRRTTDTSENADRSLPFCVSTIATGGKWN